MTKKKNISYNKALTEIKEILQQIENNDLDLDQLSAKAELVVELIQFCKEKLYTTEAEIEKILNGDKVKE